MLVYFDPRCMTGSVVGEGHLHLLKSDHIIQLHWTGSPIRRSDKVAENAQVQPWGPIFSQPRSCAVSLTCSLCTMAESSNFYIL